MLAIGIVGLPNAGKSTLFNALVSGYQAEVASHPFTTIQPNVGIVEVPDERLELLAERLSLPKRVFTTIQFVDIAGLVKGAHQGEGLGNQFLAHIRECSVILHLIRFFDEGVPASGGVVDPESDLETVRTELLLKDLETISKVLADRKIRPQKRAILERISNLINQNRSLSTLKLNEEEEKELVDLNLFSLKPVLYVANVSESQLDQPLRPALPQIDLILSTKLEFELTQLAPEERKEYLESLGQEEPALAQVIKKAYQLLGLITFYTLLPDQIQAWSIKKGSSALKAAGQIHSDFEKGFMSASVINYQDLLRFSSFQEAKQAGLVKKEGRDYQVEDGDILYFQFR